MSRKNIHPYLSDDLLAQFKKYCATANATESSVVEEALQRFFDDRYDVQLLLRRLDRHGRSIDRIKRDVDFFAQAFSVFVQVWFAHTPKLPDDARPAANSIAQKRYGDFVDYVARSCASGEKFFELLTQDVAASEDLAAAAKGTEGGNYE